MKLASTHNIQYVFKDVTIGVEKQDLAVWRQSVRNKASKYPAQLISKVDLLVWKSFPPTLSVMQSLGFIVNRSKHYLPWGLDVCIAPPSHPSIVFS